ncbi:hypothetical protein NUH86_17760 [Sphingobium sp. JS3065]|uniref:hypothetical protein n=1 Tax=Sphingobium sp. JS3065 TaxID=2970925 RepID=UPI002265570A|nr:hypothetical protein [Sphingobium sp. JS3065]UZW57434.1 hypothetical protein NUH86_17760 [Sphingobium sp. JS3065]
MELSSILCRVQAAYHRHRATNAPLENVRTVAGKAAKAWEQEAVSAERREARRERRRAMAEAVQGPQIS